MANSKTSIAIKDIFIMPAIIKIKESAIQSSIEQFLRLQENLGKLIYMKCNSGAVAMPKRGGNSWVRFGKKGMSDFVVWKPKLLMDGLIRVETLQTYFLEVKREGSKQNPDQIAFQKSVCNLGGNYFVVHSIEEVKKILCL